MLLTGQVATDDAQMKTWKWKALNDGFEATTGKLKRIFKLSKVKSYFDEGKKYYLRLEMNSVGGEHESWILGPMTSDCTW